MDGNVSVYREDNGVLIPQLPFPSSFFKKEEGGHTLTQSLILEFGYSDNAIYTLQEDDYIYKGKLYPSLKRLYMSTADYTEYDFANKYFLNYNLWSRLCKNNLFKKIIKQWREELTLKLRCVGLKSIIDIAKTPKGFAAAKFLVEKGFEPAKRGRPTKDTAEEEKQAQESLQKAVNSDFKLLEGLV